MTRLGDPHTTVARGVRVNALGTVARILHPVAFAVLTRWYGPEAMGVYLLATAAFETVATLATGGLNDAVVALVSPAGSASDAAHRRLAAAFVMALGASALGTGLAVLGAAHQRAGGQAGQSGLLGRFKQRAGHQRTGDDH